MGFNNPPVSWRQLEGTLSGRGTARDDAPFSWKRGPYQRPPIQRPADPVPYAELHAHSSFSFLDGASGPAALIEQAERLGLHAMALTDHDGFYGVVRFAEDNGVDVLATLISEEMETVSASQLIE